MSACFDIAHAHGLRLYAGRGAALRQAEPPGHPRPANDNAPVWLVGEEENTLSVNADLKGFTGHIRDSATGLNYMQARYYDPVMGRFLSIDPKGFEDTGTPAMFGRYTYVGNDPVNKTDPTGMMPPEGTVSDALRLGMSQQDAQGTSDAFTPASRGALIGMGAGAALGGAVVAGPVVASALVGAGVNSTVAGVAGAAISSGLVSAEVQTGIDVVNTGQVNVGNTLKAGAIGAAGGALTGSVPVVKGFELATGIAKAELGIVAGLAGTAAMNGADTTGSDLAAGALAGGLGGVNDVAGAAATVAVESVNLDEDK